MLVRNKDSGEVESLRYGAASDAVAAGTHAIVNVDEEGKPKAPNAKVEANGTAEPVDTSVSQPAPVPAAAGVEGKKKS